MSSVRWCFVLVPLSAAASPSFVSDPSSIVIVLVPLPYRKHELQFINVIAAITPHPHKDDDNTIGSHQSNHGYEKTPKLTPHEKKGNPIQLLWLTSSFRWAPLSRLII